MSGDAEEQTKMDCEDSVSEVCAGDQTKRETGSDQNNTAGTPLAQPQELVTRDAAAPQPDTPGGGLEPTTGAGESSAADAATGETDASPRREPVAVPASDPGEGPASDPGEGPAGPLDEPPPGAVAAVAAAAAAETVDTVDAGFVTGIAADDSDSSDESISSLSSASPTPVAEEFGDNYFCSKSVPKLKVKGELNLEDLPPVPEVVVQLPEEAKMEPVGVVTSLLGQLVVVESMKDRSPLNEDSVLFSSERKSVGKVFETFGPVAHPFYCLRFNSAEEIADKGIVSGTTLYCTPEITDYTQYIFTDKLKQLKGSDASWKDDIEPPLEAVDYSDDEQEKAAKAKGSHRPNNRPDMTEAHPAQADGQQHSPWGRGRGRGRGRPNFEFGHEHPRGHFHEGDAFGQPWAPRPPMFHNRFQGPSHGGGRGFPPSAPPYMHPGFPPQPYWQGNHNGFGNPGNYNPYFESREMGNFHAGPPNVNAPRYGPPAMHEQMPFRYRNRNEHQQFY